MANKLVSAIITNNTRTTTLKSPITEQALILMVMNSLKKSYVESKVEFEIALESVWDDLNLQSTLIDARIPQQLLSGETARFIPCLYRG